MIALPQVCYYTPDLLDMKATELEKTLPFTKLLEVEQKVIIKLVEQEYPAYLFLNNSNQKMHTQLKNDVANDYSKGNQDAYPSRFCWVIPATYQVDRCSLLRTLVLP